MNRFLVCCSSFIRTTLAAVLVLTSAEGLSAAVAPRAILPSPSYITTQALTAPFTSARHAGRVSVGHLLQGARTGLPLSSLKRSAPSYQTAILLVLGVAAQYTAQFLVAPAEGTSLACGIIFLVWKLKPYSDVRGLLQQLGWIRNYFHLVLDAVASRGPQAVGVTLFLEGRDHEVVEKRLRLVNPKRVLLSWILTRALTVYVLALLALRYKPLPYIEIYGHVRFGTSSAPAVKETHPHQFAKPEYVQRWTFEKTGVLSRERARTYTRVQRSVTHIGHNGDFDFWFIFGKWLSNDEMKTFLQRVFGTIDPTKGDSPKWAGLMHLLITQGVWTASARLAYVLSVMNDETDHVLSDTEIGESAAVLERVWSELAPTLAADKRSFRDFTVNEMEQVIQAVLTRGPIPHVPAERRDAFVRTAVHSFLVMDPYGALQFGMRRAKANASNSFGVEVLNTLYPGQVAVGAYKQAVSIAFDEKDEIVAGTSEAQALAARRGDNGKPLPWLLRLKHQGARGEVVEVTPNTLRLYSLAESREYTAQELRDARRIVPNGPENPFWDELPKPPAKINRVEQGINDISKVYKALVDSFDDETSWNRQTTDHFTDRAILVRGIYKDLLYKSRTNRVEDYVSLAEEVEATAEALLAEREAHPDVPDSDYRRRAAAYGEVLQRSVEAFDFVKEQVRDVIVAAVDVAREREDHALLLSPAQALALQHALETRLSDPALISGIVKGARDVLAQNKISAGGLNGKRLEEAERLTLKVLDEAVVDPAALRDAFAKGWQDAARLKIFRSVSRIKNLTSDHPALLKLAERIWEMIPSADTETSKTTDRRDPDILLIGHGTSQWVAEHYATLMEKAFPALDIVAETGNKMLLSVEKPSAIERRKNDFRLHLQGGYGNYRIGKRTVVVFLDQTAETYPVQGAANIIADLYSQYGARKNLFFLAGRFGTAFTDPAGQIPHPEVPFEGQLWSTLTGWRQEEPESIVPAAMDFTLSGRIFLRSLVRFRALFPSYGLLESKVTKHDAQRLWDQGRNFAEQEIPYVTGVAPDGTPMANADPHKTLSQIARRFAWHILDGPVTMVVVWTLGFLAVFFDVKPAAFFADPTIRHGLDYLYFFPVFTWGILGVVRLLTGRADRLGDRRGKQTFLIADAPHVHQTLELFVRSLFSQSYTSQGVEVHGANPTDQLLARFSKAVVAGTRVLLAIPDGRHLSNTVGQSSAMMVGSQAKGIRNFGRGAEVVAYGESVDGSRTNSLDHAVNLGGPGKNHVDPSDALYAEMEESIYSSNKRMVFGLTLFTQVAKKVSRAVPWMWFPWDRSQVGATATTRTPTPAPVGAGSSVIDDSLPPLVATPALTLRELVGGEPAFVTEARPSDVVVMPPASVAEKASTRNTWGRAVAASVLVVFAIALTGSTRHVSSRLGTGPYDSRPSMAPVEFKRVPVTLPKERVEPESPAREAPPQSKPAAKGVKGKPPKSEPVAAPPAQESAPPSPEKPRTSFDDLLKKATPDYKQDKGPMMRMEILSMMLLSPSFELPLSLRLLAGLIAGIAIMQTLGWLPGWSAWVPASAGLAPRWRRASA